MQAGPGDIFGDTSEGVPNPLVPHVHPYPTRYHGPIFNQPQFTRPFVQNPYATAPYAGLGETSTVSQLFPLVSAASAFASAYHGYKRHESIGWAVAWGLLGGLFPVITPAVALAQGYGQPVRGRR
jgi:hypothetical protein